MKKFTALLLCVAMLMVGVVVQAESGYEFIKKFLSDSNYLGIGSTVALDGTNEPKSFILAFDMPTTGIYLMGDNQQGEYEGTGWADIDASQLLMWLTIFCKGEMWTEIDEYVDEGYSYEIWIRPLNDKDKIVIDSTEKAEQLSDMTIGYVMGVEEEEGKLSSMTIGEWRKMMEGK